LTDATAVRVMGLPVGRLPPVADVVRVRVVGVLSGNRSAHPLAGTVVPSTVIGDAVAL
jgi:hypothetical protein